MLGVCLLFVGIVLLSNGVCILSGVDSKSFAIMNILAGTVTLFCCMVNVVWGNYYAAACVLLFSATYWYNVFNSFLDLDPRPIGWFSLYVAVCCVVFAVNDGILGNATLGIVADWRWAVIWILWAILWGSTFVTNVLKKDLGKFPAGLLVFEGITTGMIPSLMMLLQVW
ncbi:AmiS/UreI family transporter [Adlercreutzia sp. ZJ138]|uniref:AmiS/UreI family transporter n=1 Tax=Adlercreutzia sp. ZJ138 TaxID=2709405 RepID=UPI0013EBC117|nr:AmiS/UreI family transporter [Adlercreutzia sp. ZJ138]